MDYLTVKDVAELVRRNEETIRRMIRARKLDVTLDNNNRHQGYQIPVDELTRTWAITREEVERYIDRRRAQEQQAGETRLPLGPERAHTAVDAPPDAGDTPPVKGVAAGDGLRAVANSADGADNAATAASKDEGVQNTEYCGKAVTGDDAEANSADGADSAATATSKAGGVQNAEHCGEPASGDDAEANAADGVYNAATATSKAGGVQNAECCGKTVTGDDAAANAVDGVDNAATAASKDEGVRNAECCGKPIAGDDAARARMTGDSSGDAAQASRAEDGRQGASAGETGGDNAAQADDAARAAGIEDWCKELGDAVARALTLGTERIAGEMEQMANSARRAWDAARNNAHDAGGGSEMDGDWNGWHDARTGQPSDGQKGDTANNRSTRDEQRTPDWEVDFSAASERVSEIFGDAYRQIRSAVERATNGVQGRERGWASSEAGRRAGEVADHARRTLAQRHSDIRDAIAHSMRAGGEAAQNQRGSAQAGEAAQNQWGAAQTGEPAQNQRGAAQAGEPARNQRDAAQTGEHESGMPWNAARPSAAPEFEQFKGRQPEFDVAQTPDVDAHGYMDAEDNASYQLLQAARKAVEQRVRAARAAQSNGRAQAVSESGEAERTGDQAADGDAADAALKWGFGPAGGIATAADAPIERKHAASVYSHDNADAKAALTDDVRLSSDGRAAEASAAAGAGDGMSIAHRDAGVQSAGLSPVGADVASGDNAQTADASSAGVAAGGALANAAEAWGFAAVGSEIRPGQDGGSSKNCEAVNAADGVSYTDGPAEVTAGPAGDAQAAKTADCVYTDGPAEVTAGSAGDAQATKATTESADVEPYTRDAAKIWGFAPDTPGRSGKGQWGFKLEVGQAEATPSSKPAAPARVAERWGITLTEPKPTQTDDCAPVGTASEPAVPTERTAVAVGQGAGVQPEDENVDAMRQRIVELESQLSRLTNQLDKLTRRLLDDDKQ
ncbi:MAG TPA: helix-turn-helix domain-containing protein [Candidatus Fimadaptatus faecigallinarum]|uniref:Helix-turn-helix domain-containing protein n=1 Tax=Candidatus Fimadaptatus faecigallinarum TaxID=2840814 RepID=A0A9D1LSY9_9FIRM|nr:helix-turn-helix domain-containing protein [Candidatus Fimadaptatus faecigallinarum]